MLSVPARGGPVQTVTHVDSAAGETGHHGPVFLPDGTRFVYFSSGATGHRGMRLGRIDRSADGPDPLLMRSESAAAYVARPNGEGLLLASAGNRVAVARLDSALRPVDGVKTLPIAVGDTQALHGAGLSASETTLAFAPATPPGVRLGSVNRDGSNLTLREERELQDGPRVSPDGRTLARQRTDPQSGRIGIWVEDLATGAERQVPASGEARHPVWSPDSRRLAFAVGPQETPQLAIVAVDGSGAEANLRCPGRTVSPRIGRRTDRSSSSTSAELAARTCGPSGRVRKAQLGLCYPAPQSSAMRACRPTGSGSPT